MEGAMQHQNTFVKLAKRHSISKADWQNTLYYTRVKVSSLVQGVQENLTLSWQ